MTELAWVECVFCKERQRVDVEELFAYSWPEHCGEDMRLVEHIEYRGVRLSNFDLDTPAGIGLGA